MSESLFSNSWYRVAELRPQIAAHARFWRHHYRGQLWHVLQDPTAGRTHRLTPSAYMVIGLMDGRRSVQEIQDAVHERLGDEAPTQDETIRLLGLLHGADLLRADVTPDTAQLLERGQRRAHAEWRGRFTNPLALRVPLCDPDRWLARALPWVRPVFTRLGGAIWCAVVGAALVAGFAHGPELSADAVSQLLATQNLLLLAVVYPLVKLVHELGHAFAARVNGGEVHEMGIMFLVLMPVPYVDASSSAAFPDKRQRMLVAGAGILVELFLAAVAFFVWLNVEPGVTRSIAYNVMWIGSLSTVLFNGNPLLRFDGYYVLSDAIEVPNLAQRANQYAGYLTLRYAFGLAKTRDPVHAPGEAGWLGFYAVAAFGYRLIVMVGIAVFLASQLPAVGLLLALFAVARQLCLPIARHIDFLVTSPRLGDHRPRAIALSVSALLVLVLGLLVVPLPLWTPAEGVVWPPDDALVRAGADGFVVGALVRPETQVAKGEPLIRIREPELEARVAIVRAELRELQAQHHAERGVDRVRASLTAQKIETARARLARARERVGDVVVRSPSDGVFHSTQGDDLTGRYVRQGELLGYVVGPAIHRVRVVVPESRLSRLRDTRSVKLKPAFRPEDTFDGEILRIFPAATDILPSRALGLAGGGRLSVDPTDEDGLRTLERVFEIDVALPAGAGVREIGGRVFVRFEHGREPLIARGWRALRRLLVSRLRV